jgi:hypothetical protein
MMAVAERKPAADRLLRLGRPRPGAGSHRVARRLSTRGNWIGKVGLLRVAGYVDRTYEADAKFIERIKQRHPRTAFVDEILYSHHSGGEVSALGQGGFPPSIQIGGGASRWQGDGPDSPDVESLLQEAKDALQQAEAAEQDHVDSQTILKCIAAIQGILAQRQKGAESALGVTPAHKAMSRSTGGY